jgi:subtilase family serine protease
MATSRSTSASLALAQDGSVLFQTGWETGASFLTQVTVVPDGGDPDAGVTSLVWQPAAPGAFVFGAGGGASMVYEQPSWQVGVVPEAMADVPGAPARVVPDVSMVADPITGFLVGQTDPTSGIYGEGAVGGTSLACPLFAATMALAEQNAGRSFGFANPLLYSAAGTTAFTDIVPQTSPQDSALPGIALTFDYPGLAIGTAVGYDNVTGLGTPNGQGFLDNIQ